MNQRTLHYAFITFVILIAIVACAIPGQVIQPPPDENINTIETTIAGTVRAAATQTAATQPVETKTPGGMTSTTVERMEGRTTKYTDFDGGFKLTFPAGWLAVRPYSEEFNAAMVQEGLANQMLNDQMTADQKGYSAEFDRLYSYPLRPDIAENVIFGFSKLTFDTEDTTPLDNAGLGKLVRDLEASGFIPGFRADTVHLHEDGPVKMIEIGGHWMLREEGQGEPIPFYSTIIFFKPTPDSTVRMAFSYVEAYHDQISTDVKSIIESIQLTAP